MLQKTAAFGRQGWIWYNNPVVITYTDTRRGEIRLKHRDLSTIPKKSAQNQAP